MADSMTMSGAAQAVEGPQTLYCANHPDVETLLRCNRCNKPICVQCAVQTPVGYRCKECVREQQNVYYTGTRKDDLVALGVAFLVSAVATPIVGFFLAVTAWFSWIIAFLAGGAAGSLLAQIIRQAVGRRRSRGMRWFALAGILAGLLVGSAFAIAVFGFNPLSVISVWIFTGLAIASALPFLR
jgi:VIT1/CCC1 family predicted Fe2+/Mn2+ transporter